MKVFNNILETIGNTPIVRLNKIPEKDMKIYAKLEFFNPSGSIKDRMAYYIIRKAEEEGKINGIIVENSSGNMGASLAMIGAVKGVQNYNYHSR
jgi:cysteine synthase (EC 2.5.1.47)